MGAKILSFILYLALSYGLIYFLIGTKRFLAGWNTKEPVVSAAVVAAIILIIAVGMTIVGPVPMVLLVVALGAFIAFVKSSEALASRGVAASDRNPLIHLLPIIIALAGLSRRWLALGVAEFDSRYGKHPVVIAARRAFSERVASLTGYLRSHPRKLGNRDDDHAQATPALTDRGTPPSQVQADGAVGGAGLPDGNPLDAGEATPPPPRELGRQLTQDEARRLLDCLEGR
jgi:hypothetical protein